MPPQKLALTPEQYFVVASYERIINALQVEQRQLAITGNQGTADVYAPLERELKRRVDSYLRDCSSAIIVPEPVVPNVITST